MPKMNWICRVNQSKGKYDFNCLQLVKYNSRTWKQPHKDVHYLHNHQELFGQILDPGKTMIIRSTMHVGISDNEHNELEIPELSIYRFARNV